jgi:hypothetical protein
MAVAVQTRERQVAYRCGTTVLPGDDVIDLKRRREKGLWDTAVFTGAAGAPPNFLC